MVRKERHPMHPYYQHNATEARESWVHYKKTMIVAQQLYEGVDIKGVGAVGLVTYIRTDSTRVSEEAQQNAAEYIKMKFGEEYLPKEKPVYKGKSNSQDAHECIRPTSVDMDPESIKDSLSKEQYKLYKLIWERFVASQMAAAVYDTISADIEADKYIFKASGSSIKFPGYTLLYQEGKDEDTEEADMEIPELVENEELKQKDIEPKQHFTQPPPRYTEASLVKALEEKGIGRPSTYAPTITTILARGYIVKDGKALVPTELGRIVTDIMKNYFQEIVDVEFTAQLEKKLDEIEEGGKKWVDVMKDFYSQFVGVLQEEESQIGNIEIPDEVTDEICEKCGRNMVIKMGRNGKFLACPDSRMQKRKADSRGCRS